MRRSGFECTPIMVDGTLYLTTPFNRIVALDPETGSRRWVYDPHTDLRLAYGDGLISRGVATWVDPTRPVGSRGHRRIYEATLDARLIAIDAATGQACPDFGNHGEVSLRSVHRYRAGWYHMTSPPAVVDDVVVVGSAIDDNARVDMASGVVRAFDARTGALRWSWEPLTGLSGAKRASWKTGAANAWSVMSVDPQRHLVLVPTGSPSPDFYGGLRPGDNRWANSVVALRARTGRLVWGFQLVHHDLWDYDSAAPPLLATLRRNGRSIPVVIQGNKAGFLYVLNRDTGAPVFPIRERAVPSSDVPGETSSPTQPIPQAPPPLTPQRLSPDDAWGLTPQQRDAAREELRSMRDEGIFTPPSTRGTLSVPGSLGGMNWSGYAFDAERSLLIVNTNSLPFEVKLIPRDEYLAQARAGGPPHSEFSPQTGAPFGLRRRTLLSPSFLPISQPPWGVLTAVDMARGAIRWQVPLGSMRELAGGSPAIPPGSPSLGGPITTAGGLIFIAGTLDPFIRAFDVETGKELWKAELPASGHATPMTYKLPNGRQYIVIAAGGHAKIAEERQSDSLVAFALP